MEVRDGVGGWRLLRDNPPLFCTPFVGRVRVLQKLSDCFSHCGTDIRGNLNLTEQKPVARINLAGGQPENTGISFKNGRNLRTMPFPSVHPDGRKIAHGIRDMTAAEAWVLENFLPKAVAER